VWITVFNLFVVSVFWSFMADIWREEQGRRLFGVIAAGGSLGGLLGPVLTRNLVDGLGIAGVALVAGAFLAGTLVAIELLERTVQGRAASAHARIDEPVGGAILAGLVRLVRSPFLLGIAGLVVVGSLLGMIVYIELARFAGAAFATAAERTAFYSQRDFWVNAAALVFQLLVVGRLTTRFGVRTTLLLTTLLAVVGFVGLGLAPVLGTLLLVNIALRATEFGVSKPARDMLYTVVDAETKYKVKNVIDTAVYRGSDMASSWAHGAIAALGVGLVGFAWLSVVLATAYVGLAWAVGSGYKRRGGV
jgi:AAA family ATP:ADP antiporter